MSIQTSILLDRSTVSGGDSQALSDAVDLGEYTSLGVVMTVHEPGEGVTPKLAIEHAIRNQEGAFVPFDTPIEIALDSPATVSFQVQPFLRWVRWSLSGTLSSPAIVTVALLAKT